MIVFIQSISFVSDLVTVGILALAGIFIINGEITIGVYTAFSLYIGKLLGVTQSVGTFEITIKPVCATIERAKEFLFSDLETHKGSKKLNENIHEVFFENVSFGYKGNNIVINEMTQKFIEGDKVLLLGENGSGKTTFVKLLVGLYEPVKGKIFINNQSIDKEGFLVCRVGVGSFISTSNLDKLKDSKRRVLEEKVWDMLQQAKTLGISKEELHCMLDALCEEE